MAAATRPPTPPHGRPPLRRPGHRRCPAPAASPACFRSAATAHRTGSPARPAWSTKPGEAPSSPARPSSSCVTGTASPAGTHHARPPPAVMRAAAARATVDLPAPPIPASTRTRPSGADTSPASSAMTSSRPRTCTSSTGAGSSTPDRPATPPSSASSAAAPGAFLRSGTSGTSPNTIAAAAPTTPATEPTTPHANVSTLRPYALRSPSRGPVRIAKSGSHSVSHSPAAGRP
jgi:hypothetical protein